MKWQIGGTTRSSYFLIRNKAACDLTHNFAVWYIMGQSRIGQALIGKHKSISRYKSIPANGLDLNSSDSQVNP
jgi:hypothetical protein